MRTRTKIQRFDFLDNVEVFQAEQFEPDFPLHSHDLISLTLVTTGYECTRVEGHNLIAPTNCISLTYADEIHANPNINQGPYSFLTYYLSPDIFKHLLQTKDFQFTNRVVEDPRLFQGLSHWASSSRSKVDHQKDLQTLVQYLCDHYIIPIDHKRDDQLADPAAFAEVLDYIASNLMEKISLDEMANLLGLSKYACIRLFKKNKGITPGQYITLKRIEAAKHLLRNGHSLVDAAYSVGFYDQSHFTHNFKKLTGTTPRMYQQARNIIQDFAA